MAARLARHRGARVPGAWHRRTRGVRACRRFRRLVWTADRRAGTAPLSTRHLPPHRVRRQQPRRAATSIADQAAQLRSLLAQLGLRRVHLVGHSSGALIALQLALDAPQAVQTLTLLEPALPIAGTESRTSHPPCRNTARENPTPPSTPSCAPWRDRITAPPSSARFREHSTRRSPTHPHSSSTSCLRCARSASTLTMRSDCGCRCWW